MHVSNRTVSIIALALVILQYPGNFCVAQTKDSLYTKPDYLLNFDAGSSLTNQFLLSGGGMFSLRCAGCFYAGVNYRLLDNVNYRDSVTNAFSTHFLLSDLFQIGKYVLIGSIGFGYSQVNHSHSSVNGIESELDLLVSYRYKEWIALGAIFSLQTSSVFQTLLGGICVMLTL